MAEEEEPKHPYVSNSNAKVHLIFSIVVLIMSLIQVRIVVYFNKAKYYKV